ncbi:MAG: flotillin family protein [Deltaproteobacteria bacterium]|nr:flotillin family protein [Deltaproteobacteria bacterium]
MDPLLVIVGVVVLAVLVVLLSVKSLVIICQPSEVVIFSGPPKREGARVGYRAVRGGRGLRIPLIESVSRLDVTNMSVDVSVQGAYTSEGVPLNVQGVANVKIDGEAPGLDNAVERLLGKSREEIAKMARETLEGNLRGVLARLTPEQVNEDKESFARELIEEAESDLGRLGLMLDTLKIQTVADEVGYLEAKGRKQNAELQKRSRSAEAERQSESAIQGALNMQRTRIAQIAATTEIQKAEAEKRIIGATTARPAVVAREKANIEAQIARAEAELRVQRARIEQVRVQLEADLVAPARAYKAQKEAEAQAEVAPIRESGVATAEGLKQLATKWREAGDSAREIFLLEKLRTLVGIMVGTVRNAHVDQLTFVGSSGAEGGSAAGKVAGLVEQLKASGIDVPALLGKIGAVGTGVGAVRTPVVPREPEVVAPVARPAVKVEAPKVEAPVAERKRK